MRYRFAPAVSRVCLALIIALTGIAGVSQTSIVRAATFAIPSGDVGALIAAIDEANANGQADTIELASGATYTIATAHEPAPEKGPNGLPVISSKITIVGNGATISRSSEPVTPMFRILQVVQGGNLTLDDVTITNGAADDSTPELSIGGGIYQQAGVVTLTNSSVSGNWALSGGGIGSDGGPLDVTSSTVTLNTGELIGGGIYKHNGQLTITSSTVSANDATFSGGGITSNGPLIVTDSTVIGNYAQVSGGGIGSSGQLTITSSDIRNNMTGLGLGGGILKSGSTMTITDTSIVGNSASNSGGGIAASGCTATITGSNISDNAASGTGGGVFANGGSTIEVHNSTIDGNSSVGYGGGIFALESSLSIVASTISENIAEFGGGIAGTGEQPVVLTDSTVVGNEASFFGGGSYTTSPFIVTNTTVVGNVANGFTSFGGGVAAAGPLTMTNSTVTGNWVNSVDSSSGAGGIFAQDAATLTNVLVAGNSAPRHPDIAAVAAMGAHNLIGQIQSELSGAPSLVDGEGGNQVGTAAEPIDPLLAPLAYNGGPTQTMELLSGSPAIDAGDTAAGSTTDQRGTIRPQGAASDIGAYEVDSTPPVITPLVDGTLGNNGWYTSDVAVSWTIDDALLVSTGCETTTINTDTAGTPLTCAASSTGGTSSESITIKRDATAPTITFTGNQEIYGPSDTITITCEASDAMSGLASNTCSAISGSAESFGHGTHTYSATATDHAGNTTSASISFLVDLTPPQISPTITGTLGANGWYTSDVSVTWNVVDDETEITNAAGCDQTTISTDIAGQTLTCEATSTGGTSRESVIIRRDATEPIVTYTGNLGTYNADDSISISCTASDELSGVASSTCADITGTGMEFGPGTHTFTATATDNAGNVGTGTISFNIGITYDQLCTLTQELVTNASVERNACAALRLAESAAESGNMFMVEIMLTNYRVQIRSAMSRRYVSAPDGQTLLDWSYVV